MPVFDTEDLKSHLRKSIGDRFYGDPILILSYDHASLLLVYRLEIFDMRKRAVELAF